MNNPIISIIVPIYNQEKVMRKCLDSILKQTFLDWECILVDDGSTDHSGEICDEYARLDNRIKVIHKKNGGVAMARQTGVDHSIGEYTIHADPDDYVEPTMLEDMYAALKEQHADILVCDFIVDYINGGQAYVKQDPGSNDISVLIEKILTGKLHGSLWNKLAHRSIYYQLGARFYEGLNYCEDVLIWCQLENSKMNVGYLPKSYYHYTENIGSITHKVDQKLYSLRKKFVNKLDVVISNKDLVLEVAHRNKLAAIQSGILSRSDYYSYYKPPFKILIKKRLLAYMVFGVFAYIHLFYTGKIIMNIIFALQNCKFYKVVRTR